MGAGGVATLIGALVYAELAAAYPSTGGEYHFLTRAYGQPVGFLFAWARTTVIQTGAIAAVCFVLGDYAQQIWSLGTYGAAIYGAVGLLVLTLVNLAGTYESKTAQNVLTVLESTALAAIALVGFIYGGGAVPAAAPAAATSFGAFGLAMVLVLITYGGWNEAAYLSADLKNVKRDMIRILLVGTAVVTVLYVLINIAYLNVLGLEGLRKSDAVAATVMRTAFGPVGAIVLSLIVICAAASTINASIFTGAQSLSRARTRPAARAAAHLACRRQQPAQRDRRAEHNLLCADLLRRDVAGRLSGNGVVHLAGLLVLPHLGRHFDLCATTAGSGSRASVPGAALSADTDPVLPDVRLHALFEPRVYAASKEANIAGWFGIGVLLLGVPLMFFARGRRAS